MTFINSLTFKVMAQSLREIYRSLEYGSLVFGSFLGFADICRDYGTCVALDEYKRCCSIVDNSADI